MKLILIIEDDKAMRDSMDEMLKDAGYMTICAADGSKGVKVAKTAKPDAILCDILLPKLNGYEVYDSLQQHPETATIPFIYVTCMATKEDFRRGMSLGADDYITKPFSIHELLSAIESRLRRRSY